MRTHARTQIREDQSMTCRECVRSYRRAEHPAEEDEEE